MKAVEDTEMNHNDEVSIVLSGADRHIEYAHSVGTQDLQSNDSNEMTDDVEQTMTITGHDVNNTAEVMDYTSTTIDNGSQLVQNGSSLNRTGSSINDPQRTQLNDNINTNSAKTDYIGGNE
jgi:hypothetical protein